jgi:hypothetical protein
MKGRGQELNLPVIKFALYLSAKRFADAESLYATLQVVILSHWLHLASNVKHSNGFSG